jgi:D-sedoheptulose 7-phosphate isomerase
MMARTEELRRGEGTMKDRDGIGQVLNMLLERHPELGPLGPKLSEAAVLLVETFETGHKVLTCGNGGSAADADHIVGELMKGFTKRRPVAETLRSSLIEADPELGARLAGSLQCGLPAIALTQHAALISAFANDVEADMVYAQQVLGYGNPGDLLWGISTSGNARNVNYAAITARALGLKVLGMTGRTGGSLASRCDICLEVPETETWKVQELHLPVYHALCLAAESVLFP